MRETRGLANPSTGPRGRSADDPPLRTATLGPIAAGIAIVVLGIGGFGTWAALAPLHSAAVASGIVTVAGKRKTVQHLEGGIIDEILVEEGTKVSAGQVLVRLSDTRARAILELMTGRYQVLLAQEARLRAERAGTEQIVFPEELLRHPDDPRVIEAIKGQRLVFEAKREAMASATRILGHRIEQYHEEIGGREAQTRAADQQLATLREEMDAVEALLEQGNALKPRLLALRRRQAEIAGERGAGVALIALARQRIAEAEQQILDLRHRRFDEVAEELQAVQAEIFDHRERMRDAADVLDRLEVRAPVAGTVVELAFHTRGAVIGPGEPILDLVPEDDQLVIEARIRPQDIDVVRVGLTTQVRLSAYSARRTPSLDGTVAGVSADRLIERSTGAAYYLARIELDPAEIAELPEIELYPGMPAEAMIVTGRRTALDYLLDPIINRVDRAFRES